MNPKLLSAMIVAFVIATVAAAASSIYGAYVAHTNHHAACARTALILNSFEAVIDLATTPKPGQKITAVQQQRIDDFKAAAYAQLDKARC